MQPRHAAAAVTQDHEAAGAFGHGALGASDADRDPTHLVDGGHDGVATDQVAQPCGEAVAEPVEHRVVHIEMDVDPVTIAAGGVGDGVEGAVGDLHQRIDFGCHDTVALEQGVLCFTQRGVQDRAVVGVELTAQLPASVVVMPQRQQLHRIPTRLAGLVVVVVVGSGGKS